MTDLHDDEPDDEEPLLDRRGYRRPIATLPGYHSKRGSSMAGKKKPPIVLRERYVLALLDACDNTPTGLRSAAIIALMWRTGATITELLDMRLSQLDLSRGTESVRLKTGRLVNRRLALDPFAVRYVNKWMKLRDTLPGDYFLCILTGPTAGQDWHGTDFRRTLKGLAAKIETTGGQRLTRPPTPNDFRVTFAAELMMEQWPLAYIQTQMGLDSIGTFKVLLPQLGIQPADQDEVMEIARSRPQPRS